MKCSYEEHWNALFAAAFDDYVEPELGPEELARRGWTIIISPEGEEFYAKDPKARSASYEEALRRVSLIEDGQHLGFDAEHLLDLSTDELEMVIRQEYPDLPPWNEKKEAIERSN